MSLTLDSRELALLGRATSVLLSPLEADDLDEWRRRVNRAVRELLGGDKVLFALPGSGGDRLYSEEHRNLSREYVEYYSEIDQGLQRVRSRGLEVFCRRALFPGDRDLLLRSECYNDFLSPNGIEDSIGMMVDPRSESSAAIWIHNEAYGRENAGPRGMAILHLLLPAFRSGTRLASRFGRAQAEIAAVIDSIADGAAIFDLDMRPLHRNAALERLLSSAPQRRALELRISEVARASATLARGGAGGESLRTSESCVVGGSRWRIEASLLERPLGVGRQCVLVTVTRPAAHPPDRSALRNRFGLTPRQAQVAALLAERKTNREIAEALHVSEHTVRRHTEQVLSKVGAGRRTDVPAALSGVPRE